MTYRASELRYVFAIYAVEAAGEFPNEKLWRKRKTPELIRRFNAVLTEFEDITRIVFVKGERPSYEPSGRIADADVRKEA